MIVTHTHTHREIEREAETLAEGEAGSMHWEPDVGFDPGSPGSRPGPKAGAKPLRHPGIPFILFIFCDRHFNALSLASQSHGIDRRTPPVCRGRSKASEKLDWGSLHSRFSGGHVSPD